MRNKFNILVLSDLNETTSKTIKSGVSFAKIVDADINFFYVKKPTEIVEKESQLSAMRTINKAYFSIDKKIKKIIEPISKTYDTTINHTFTIGNIKNEIGKYIDENKPDIIVLGKKKNRIVNFMSDNITPFILKNFKGPIVIADDKNYLEPNTEMSLGVFNNINPDSLFTKNIFASTQKPLKIFRTFDNSSTLKKETCLEQEKIVEYIFEKSDNVIKNISNYLSKSNVNLVFVEREENGNNLLKPSIKEVIKNLDCSLILTP